MTDDSRRFARLVERGDQGVHLVVVDEGDHRGLAADEEDCVEVGHREVGELRGALDQRDMRRVRGDDEDLLGILGVENVERCRHSLLLGVRVDQS